jgi:DNA-binding protein HU-beta
VASMTKAELIDKVSSTAGVAKTEAEKVLGAFFDTVSTAAKTGTKVSWPRFGSFTSITRKARMGRNPATGAAVRVPASLAMKFSPSSVLKGVLNTKGGAAKKTTAKKSTAKKAPAKKTTARKTTAKKTTAKKTTAKKTTAKKS